MERICAIQAQWPQSPYIALWARMTGFRKDQLTHALERLEVVKSQMFRGTLHMSSARDYPYYAAAWLPRTRTLTPLVHLLPSGTWSHYGRAQVEAMEAVLRVELPTFEEGAERLVRRYLAAFGPATESDLLRFSGVRAGDARAGLDSLTLRRFRDERGRLLLDLPRAPLPTADTPAPVRFLPKWDSSILAYTVSERARILPDRFGKTVIKPNGDVAPTVLVDGFVAAKWEIDRKGSLKVERLRRLTKQERAEVDEEGERLVEFFLS